ncbi:MAG: hypothetical protein ACRDOG_12520, partial [Gaiellaceae bacterium]
GRLAKAPAPGEHPFGSPLAEWNSGGRGSTHPQPTGPAGMALFIAGVAWLELWPRQAKAPEAVSVQPT